MTIWGRKVDANAERVRRIRLTQRKLQEATGQPVTGDQTLEFLTAITWVCWARKYGQNFSHRLEEVRA